MGEDWPSAHIYELRLHSLPARGHGNGDEHHLHRHLAVREGVLLTIADLTSDCIKRGGVIVPVAADVDGYCSDVHC